MTDEDKNNETQSTDPNAPNYWPSDEDLAKKGKPFYCPVSIQGMGKTEDLTKHDVGEWIDCCECKNQFQLREYFNGICHEEDDEEREAWQGEDTGEDRLVFICYECTKSWYRCGFFDAKSMALMGVDITGLSVKPKWCTQPDIYRDGSDCSICSLTRIDDDCKSNYDVVMKAHEEKLRKNRLKRQEESVDRI